MKLLKRTVTDLVHPDDILYLRRCLQASSCDALSDDIEWAWMRYCDAQGGGWIDPRSVMDPAKELRKYLQ